MNILILDDKIECGELIAEHIQLRIPECTYVLAQAPGAAVKQVLLQQFDLLIADVFLGNGESGLDFVKWFKIKNKNAKVIIYTGKELSEDIDSQIYEIDPDYFEKKPIYWKGFVAKVKEICNYKPIGEDTEGVLAKIRLDCVRHGTEIEALKENQVEIRKLLYELLIPKIDKQFLKILMSMTGVMTLFSTIIYLILKFS